jgi:hypothetical protein
MGRTGFGWLRIGSGGGNEPSASIKRAGYCLTCRVNFEVFKEFPAPWSNSLRSSPEQTVRHPGDLPFRSSIFVS